MKKIFLLCCFFVAAQASASTREFSSVEEAKADVQAHNEELMRQSFEPQSLPSSDAEMAEYIRKRLEVVDITVLPKGERLDKASSFSRVDENVEPENKSFLEKIYDNAIARVSGKSHDEELQPVEYYAPLQEEEISQEEEEAVIDIKLPDGRALRAPAFEHIPSFSTQIEILPNRLMKVRESITIIANGQKVKEGLLRFIRKKSVSRYGKIRLFLEKVTVNDTEVKYEVVEQSKYYLIRPVKNFKLSEGVYIFEFQYVVDRFLWDYGDFYEFYWDVTGGHYNLPIARSVLAVQLPGREPAVKQFVLTGRLDHLVGDNAVFMRGEGNTIGFMNISPLLNGESMHVLMTLPKVEFEPESKGQKILRWLEDGGDILLCLIYFLVAVVSCWLSWHYIRRRLKFKNITVSSVLLMRSLWRGGPDYKSFGGALLDLFRKTVVDFESGESGVVLVRKSAHTRRISKFDKKLMNILFVKKDSICRSLSTENVKKVKRLIQKETDKQMKLLGFRMGGAYLIFNILLLLAVELGICLWNPNAVLPEIFIMADAVIFVMLLAFIMIKGRLWQKIVSSLVCVVSCLFSGLILSVYMSWTAIVLLLAGVWVSIIFCRRILERDALLKNAVQSVQQMREFLSSQKEHIGQGRNFVLQQAGIFALDLEDEYAVNNKIKNSYRLDIVKRFLEKVIY